MGGVKRKIAIEKIEKKDPRAVAFSKRRMGLYSKASELCLLSDAQIAIIATPVSSNSNVSFYTFGHSSVDSVVAAFLANQRPRDERSGFWWEDESLANSENPEELRDGIDSMSKMLQDLKALENKRRDREDVKKEKGVSHGTHQKQTLNPQPCFSSVCNKDNITVNFEGFHKTTEEQTLAVSDNGNNNGLLGNFDGCNQELDLDQILAFVTNSEDLWKNLEMDDVSMVTMNQNLCSGSEAVEDRELVIHRDLDEDQMLAISDNNKNNNALRGNVGGCNQEMNFEQIIDFEVETKSEGLSMNNVSMATTYQNPRSVSKADVVGELVTHNRDLYDDNIHLSDLDEDQILAISDNNNNNSVLPGNFSWFNQELDLDQIIDFETNSESLLMNLESLMNLKMDGVSMATTEQNMYSGSEVVEDGGLVIPRDLDEDNLCFSEFFSELTSIAAL